MTRILAALLVLASTGFVQAQVVRPNPHERLPEFIGFVPDELVVVLDAQGRSELTVTRDVAGRPRVNIPFMQRTFERHDVRSFERQFASARPRPEGSRYPDLTSHYKLRLGPGRDLDAALLELEVSPGVDHVEKIGIHALYQTPNDPYFQGFPNPSFPYDQWHLHSANGIDADQAWNSEAGSPDVLVGILDSGTRYFHVDLGGNAPVWGPDNPVSA